MLPATGGIGVNLFYAVGAFLIIGGLFLAVMKGLGGEVTNLNQRRLSYGTDVV